MTSMQSTKRFCRPDRKVFIDLDEEGEFIDLGTFNHDVPAWN